MVNINKLKGKMIEKGYNVASLSKAIGMHRGTFYRKLNHDGDFTIKEANAMVLVLSLNRDEVNAIFFSQIVA